MFSVKNITNNIEFYKIKNEFHNNKKSKYRSEHPLQCLVWCDYANVLISIFLFVF